jgi:hypothetical protein
MTESGQGSGSGSGGAGANDGARGETGGASEVNYAISIYPYFAEREDEFDVVVWVSSLPFCLFSFLPC